MGGWGIIPQYCQGGPVCVVVMSARSALECAGGEVVTLIAGYVEVNARLGCGHRSRGALGVEVC